MSWSKTNQQIADLTPDDGEIERARERKPLALFFFSLSSKRIPRELRDIIFNCLLSFVTILFGSVLRVGDRCIHTDKVYRDFIIPLVLWSQQPIVANMVSISSAAEAGMYFSIISHPWKREGNGWSSCNCIVARIAYLTSDTVLSVQPSLQNDSLFSKALKVLKANKTTNLTSKVTEVSWKRRGCQTGTQLILFPGSSCAL